MIKIFTKTSEIQDFLAEKSSIGFVPTMGNLHAGHISLLKESVKENEISIISIFVNPTQFAQGEDFTSYPRTLDADIKKIEEAISSKYLILVFAPESESEIYPEGKQVIKAFGPCNVLEGALRPGHFDGVVTVVKRLFEIIPANKAYFGKKDFQQYTIIKQLVKEFNFPIEIVGLPIIREDSGLAMSSRNGYLSTEEKEEALILWKTLNDLKLKIEQNPPIEDIQKLIKEILADKRFNYLALCHPETLEELSKFSPKMVLLGNFQIKSTKLLDNLEIEGI